MHRSISGERANQANAEPLSRTMKKNAKRKKKRMREKEREGEGERKGGREGEEKVTNWTRHECTKCCRHHSPFTD